MRIFISVILILLFSQIAYGAPTDIAINLYPSELNFQLIDPNGNITGYDPSTQSVLKNIPKAWYIDATTLNSPDVPPTKYEKFHELQTWGRSVTAGTYKLKIFGYVSPDNMDLVVSVGYVYSRTNATAGSFELKTLIFPNVTWTYEFTATDTPPANNRLIVTKVASPDDLIADINAAASIGYIGNQEFVNELIKEIQEIEKERTAVRTPGDKEKEHLNLTPAQKAIKEYKELLKEITEKYQQPEGNEFVRAEAYTVLKEDLEYIIGHIQ